MQEFYFPFKNSQFAALDSGKGAAVVFLHGFLENKSMWQQTVQHLPKKYRCIALDLPGHGQSDNLGYVHSMDEMAEVVKALTDHLKLRKVVLVGHSMGGYVALAMAEKYPDLIKGVVLLNSSARADSDQRQHNRDRAIALVKSHSKRYVRTAIPLLFRPKNRIALSDAVRQVKEQALATSRQGIIAALEGMKNRPDREVLLHFGAFPCFVIAGKNDPVIPLALIEEQVSYSNLKHLYLENGHMSHLEDFEEMLKGLKGFLAGVT